MTAEQTVALERLRSYDDMPWPPGPDITLLVVAMDEAIQRELTTGEAMNRAIEAAKPTDVWIAIPHEQWRDLLAVTAEGRKMADALEAVRGTRG